MNDSLHMNCEVTLAVIKREVVANVMMALDVPGNSGSAGVWCISDRD